MEVKGIHSVVCIFLMACTSRCTKLEHEIFVSAEICSVALFQVLVGMGGVFATQ